MALSGAAPIIPSLTEEIVGARYPTPPEPETLKAEESGWRAATSGVIAR